MGSSPKNDMALQQLAQLLMGKNSQNPLLSTEQNPFYQIMSKYVADGERPQGMISPGNINLFVRPSIPNPEGGISSVFSESADFDGKTILYPRAVDNRILATEEAIKHMLRTRQHLGIFDTPEDADNYANNLHLQQELYYGKKR